MATDNQASLRATRETFVMETVFVSSRSKISNSTETDWKKINTRFSTGGFSSLEEETMLGIVDD